MSSDFGQKVRISLFGESHGECVGVVIDGLPENILIDTDKIYTQLSRRAPGKDKTATPREESDVPEIISGVLNNRTTGAPLCAVIKNSNTRSSDYEKFARYPRPSHADYTAMVRYNGANDLRGSGHFSARLTAPLVFAGAICRDILEQKGITIGGHICQIGNVFDDALDPVNVNAEQLKALSSRYFSVINENAEQAMRDAIEEVRLQGDSIGGTVEVAVCGVEPGIGSPIFDGIENEIAKAVFGIPAAKGIEFGKGFAFASERGSMANDPFAYNGERVVTTQNNNGGILGGISTGMPIIFRTVFKPTASIAIKQNTVDLMTQKNSELTIEGRHDPCIAVRALPVVESACAIALINIV